MPGRLRSRFLRYAPPAMPSSSIAGGFLMLLHSLPAGLPSPALKSFFVLTPKAPPIPARGFNRHPPMVASRGAR